MEHFIWTRKSKVSLGVLNYTRFYLFVRVIGVVQCHNDNKMNITHFT